MLWIADFGLNQQRLIAGGTWHNCSQQSVPSDNNHNGKYLTTYSPHMHEALTIGTFQKHTKLVQGLYWPSVRVAVGVFLGVRSMLVLALLISTLLVPFMWIMFGVSFASAAFTLDFCKAGNAYGTSLSQNDPVHVFSPCPAEVKVRDIRKPLIDNAMP